MSAAIFIKANPICIFCGGSTPSTTKEHCPPRAMFQHRQWPEGFEFPACDTCNGGTRDDDLLIAMLARLHPFQNKGDVDGKTPGLMARAHERYPGMFRKMLAIDEDGQPHGRSPTRCAKRWMCSPLSSPRASTTATREQYSPVMAAWS